MCMLGDVWGQTGVRAVGGPEQAARGCAWIGEKRQCPQDEAVSTLPPLHGRAGRPGTGSRLSTGPWVHLFTSPSLPPHLERRDAVSQPSEHRGLPMAEPC